MKLIREISTGVDLHAITCVLRELREDSYAHSWSVHVPRNGEVTLDHARALVAREAARPTRFFTYRGEGGELLGVATIAARVSSRFAFDGFPVLARGYVRRAYRGRGLYQEMLNHRVGLCRDELGPRLRAIHLGTNNPCVASALAQRGEPAFTLVGEEEVHGATVGTYLAFAPAFVEQLARAADALGERSHAAWSLGATARRLGAGSPSPRAYDAFRRSLSRIERETGEDLRRTSSAWNELLHMLETIPVIATKPSDTRGPARAHVGAP
jgi:hypothetical protein